MSVCFILHYAVLSQSGELRVALDSEMFNITELLMYVCSKF